MVIPSFEQDAGGKRNGRVDGCKARGMDRTAPALVAVGGFAGACARYGVGLVVAGAPGTLVANVVGSLALGALAGGAPGRRATLLFGTGLLSAFTTYSTFAVETVALGPVAGTANAFATYAAGVTAALVGLAAGRRLHARGQHRGHDP
jgi:CrcB protein